MPGGKEDAMVKYDRRLGKIVHIDMPTPEQAQKLHEAAMRDYVKRHPEILQAQPKEVKA